MAKRVIDVLKTVHVDRYDGEIVELVAFLVEQFGDLLFEASSVQKSRERILGVKIHDVCDTEVLLIEIELVDDLADLHEDEFDLFVDEAGR